MPHTAIIDYGMGNHFSVAKKVRRLNHEAVVTADHERIRQASRIILPGVGHFGRAMDNLKQRGLIDVLNEVVIEGKRPILGICLGMQLFASHSEEGDVAGLGWIDANVKRLAVKDPLRFKVPHTGWNKVVSNKASSLLQDIPDGSEFYFVHAYHVVCNDESDRLSSTTYDSRFTSAIARDHICGVQFHPEKSHDAGTTLLQNFLHI